MDVGGKLRRFSVFEDKRGHYVIFIRIREFHHTPITLSQQFGATEQTTSSRIAKQDKPRQRFTNLVFRSRTSYPKVFSNPIYYGGSHKFITGELFLPTRQIFLAPKQSISNMETPRGPHYHTSRSSERSPGKVIFLFCY